MAGSLLAARTVDLLVVDLPDGRDPAVARRSGWGTGWAGSRRWPGGRGRCSCVLEPVRSGGPSRPRSRRRAACGWSCARTGWIRLGRDVVGQRSAVTVARNRYGPPGRRADLEILLRGRAAPATPASRRDGLLAGLAVRRAAGIRAAPPGTRHRPRPHRHRATTTDRPPERPPAIDRFPCACCTCSGRTCPSAWRSAAWRPRRPTAPPPRGRPARSSSAASPGRTGSWSTRTRSHGRSACVGGSRSGAPTGSRPRRPSSTSP